MKTQPSNSVLLDEQLHRLTNNQLTKLLNRLANNQPSTLANELRAYGWHENEIDWTLKTLADFQRGWLQAGISNLIGKLVKF